MRVSILIPSYNHDRFLSVCLASVRAQTFNDWEALVVDDGSSDASVETARTFATQDPRIRVFVNEANLGTYGTQQRALEMASGSLVAVLNSDDYWEPEKLAIQVALLEKHPDSRFAYALGTLVDENGDPFRTQNQHADWPTEERQELLPWLLSENRIVASGVLFRREGMRFETSLRYSGDWVALLEQSAQGPAAFANRPLSAWRQHASNTYLGSPSQMLEEIRVRRAIAALPLGGSEYREGLGQNALHLAALYAYFGETAGFWRSSIAALRLHPDRRRARRRLLSAFVGSKRRRRHLWPQAEKLSPSEITSWRRRLAELAPLNLQVSPR